MNQTGFVPGPRGPQSPWLRGGLAFLSECSAWLGVCEEEKEHTQRAFRGHLLVQVGTRICPVRGDRAALKCKTKELGFALQVCVYAMGSQVGKSNQMAQVWPSGPMQGMGTRPGSGEGDSCSPWATPAPVLALHQQEKQNKRLQAVCLKNTRFY